MKMLNIKEAMNKNVIAVCWSDDLESSYQIMRDAGVRHLVVVDDFGFLRGVISDRDFQRATLGDPLSVEFVEGSIIKDFMNWPAETISSKAKLREAAQEMINKKISALVITEDDEEATGIITHEDLLRVLVQLLGEKSTFKDKLIDTIYSTPLGSIVNLLKEMGI